MPLIADLIDPAAAERLAAAVREQAGQRQAAEAVPVTAPVCEACGQRLPGQPVTSPHEERHTVAAPAAVFRSGAEQP